MARAGTTGMRFGNGSSPSRAPQTTQLRSNLKLFAAFDQLKCKLYRSHCFKAEHRAADFSRPVDRTMRLDELALCSLLKSPKARPLVGFK